MIISVFRILLLITSWHSNVCIASRNRLYINARGAMPLGIAVKHVLSTNGIQ